MLRRETIARLGTPEESPETWALTSPRTYFDRVTDPILIHHGTADESCPIEWSRETVAALKQAGKKVTYYVYEGQRHTFTSSGHSRSAGPRPSSTRTSATAPPTLRSALGWLSGIRLGGKRP